MFGAFMELFWCFYLRRRNISAACGAQNWLVFAVLAWYNKNSTCRQREREGAKIKITEKSERISDFLLTRILTRSITDEDLRTIIKYVRVYNGMTQKEVAEKMGISRQQYQKYEYGTIACPTSVNRERLCAALSINPKIINALAARAANADNSIQF